MYKPFRYGYSQFENVNDTTRNVRTSFSSIFNAELPITFFSFVFKGYLTEIEEVTEEAFLENFTLLDPLKTFSSVLPARHPLTFCRRGERVWLSDVGVSTLAFTLSLSLM